MTYPTLKNVVKLASQVLNLISTHWRVTMVDLLVEFIPIEAQIFLHTTDVCRINVGLVKVLNHCGPLN